MRSIKKIILYLFIIFLFCYAIFKFIPLDKNHSVPLKSKEAFTADPWTKHRWLHVKILTDTLRQFKKTKTVLLWTPFFGAHDYVPEWSRLNCPVPKCFITSNRSYLNQSDALLFHLRDVNVKDMPAFRTSNQKWILLHHESPPHTPRILKFFNGLFNWTATYRMESEISLSPKVEKQDQHVIEKNYAENKTKMAVWFVSNCKTPSNRENFVKELQKSIPVDIYGTCGSLSCLPKMSDECYDKATKPYRYYLSLENSICKDYVTEKFYRILSTDMIPVVMGGANYSMIAPPLSYINALSFKSPHNLAHFLLSVAKDDSKYNSYFKWRKTHKLSIEHYACQICRKLHENESKLSSYDDLDNWWFHNASCRTWSPIQKSVYLPRN